MRSPPRKTSAFTLLELIVVMAILTIALGMIAPSMRWFGVGRTNQNAAALIVGLSNYARTQAASEGRVYRLNFDPTAASLWLTAQNGAAFDPPANEYGRKYELADGTSMRTDLNSQQDGTYVEFAPSGRTQPARIWLTDKTGGVVEVACDSATELFRILPPAEVTQ